MKKNSLGVGDETKLFMIKKLLHKGFKLKDIEKELDIKDLFKYMQYNASGFYDIKFRKEENEC